MFALNLVSSFPPIILCTVFCLYSFNFNYSEHWLLDNDHVRKFCNSTETSKRPRKWQAVSTAKAKELCETGYSEKSKVTQAKRGRLSVHLQRWTFEKGAHPDFRINIHSLFPLPNVAAVTVKIDLYLFLFAYIEHKDINHLTANV